MTASHGTVPPRRNAVPARRKVLPARRATLEAIARAVLPGEGSNPELLGRTVGEAIRIQEALEPPAPALLAATTWALEVVTRRRSLGGMRFSSLDPDAARAALARLEQGRSPFWMAVRLLRDVVVMAHYEQPEVRASMGYEPDGWIESQAAARLATHRDDIERHQRLLVAPAPLLPSPRAAVAPERAGGFHDSSELPAGGLDCDVVVVGSGAGGAVVAAELAESGLDVVVLEEGGHHRRESFTTSTTEMLRRLYRGSGGTTTLGRVPVQYSEGRCVGGSTVVNGAMAFRAPERVLAGWATTSGIGSLAAGGLDDEYARVERFLSVGPPDPGSGGRDQELLRSGAAALDWRVVENQRAHVHCVGCNVCTWGCPTGAKQSTLESYLPRAVAFGAHVWSRCRVDRVELRGKRAVGVQATVVDDAPGATGPPRSFTVRARCVVVACGAVQTPALLQRSGVRSPSGQLGRDLSVHPGAQVAAEFDEPVEGWKGAHQTHQVRELDGVIMAAVNLPPSLVARSLPFAGDALGEVMDRYDRIVTAGVLVEDAGRGRVRAVGRSGRPLVTYPLHPRDGERVLEALGRLSELLFAAGATVVHPGVDGVAPLRSPDDLRRLAGFPGAVDRLVLSTVHLMGTAAIGTDPTRSVCGPDGAVHDTTDLYVADASLFPGPVGVNPMLTIMALATRVARGVAETYT